VCGARINFNCDDHFRRTVPAIIAEVEADDDSVEGDTPTAAAKESTTKEMAEESNCIDVATLRNALENMSDITWMRMTGTSTGYRGSAEMHPYLSTTG
jgi:hypothetical protein